MTIAFFAIVITVVVFFIVWAIRIEMADREIRRAIKRVSAAAQADIAAGRQWNWRYDALDVSRDFDAIVRRFWTRPSRYYRDQSFMDPTVQR